MLTAPRVYFAMANDKLFFKKLAEVHPRFGTPAAAVLALGVWSCVLALAGGFAKLADGVIFIGWIFYGLGAAAIFPIRRANKGKHIPYRVPGYPVTPLLFVLAALALVGNAIYAAVKDPHAVHLPAGRVGVACCSACRLSFSGAANKRDNPQSNQSNDSGSISTSTAVCGISFASQNESAPLKSFVNTDRFVDFSKNW